MGGGGDDVVVLTNANIHERAPLSLTNYSSNSDTSVGLLSEGGKGLARLATSAGFFPLLLLSSQSRVCCVAYSSIVPLVRKQSSNI